MNSKYLAGMVGMIAMMSMSDPFFSTEEKKRTTDGITGKTFRNIPKGCSVFEIGGKEIVALNLKSAQKKYEKMKLIN